MGFKVSLLLLCVLSTLFVYCFAGENGPGLNTETLPAYTLEITGADPVTSLEITEKLEVLNTTVDTWHELVLSCPPAFHPGYFTLLECDLRVGDRTDAVRPRVEGSMIEVALPSALEPGQRVTFTMRYRLALPDIDPGDLPPVGNFGRGKRLIQAGDFYAALTPYVEGGGFMRWKYAEVGDPVVYTPSNFEVSLKLPPAYMVAAAGLTSAGLPDTKTGDDRAGNNRDRGVVKNGSGDGGTWRCSLKGVRSFAFLASTEYAVFTDAAQGIPIRSYYLKGFERAGRDACAVAKRALTLYIELYGPYPYQELVLAQNAYLGAMEYSVLCTESGVAYEYYKGGSRSFFEYVIAHEIAHPWWYGAVGNDQVHAPWLDEAMALYSEYLYYKRYHPADLDWWWDIKVKRRDAHGFLDASIYDYPTTKLYIKNVYGLAPRFMLDLNTLVGDAAFRAFLLDYRKKYENKLATKKDFFDTLKAHTDKDLAPLQKYFKNPF
jgi:hypothetical protein